MARLRIRIELSSGGTGVPLHKLASVISETQKFLHLVGDDVGLDEKKGEWLGFEFDRKTLDFTAEYIGPVTAEQARAFNAAFDGTTSLRRGTIAQFAAIANAIGEDEVIGFGLYQSGQEEEPSEWRCLSRRDALRIANEIQVLLAASGEVDRESYLPAVRHSDLESRMFGDRRERSVEQTKLAAYVQKVEAALSNRITGVEKQVEEHSGLIRDLRSQSALTEESFRHLLAAIENFCGQATRQIESATPPAAPREFRSGLPRWWLAAAASVAAVLLSGLLLSKSSGWFGTGEPPIAQASSKRVEDSDPARATPEPVQSEPVPRERVSREPVPPEPVSPQPVSPEPLPQAPALKPVAPAPLAPAQISMDPPLPSAAPATVDLSATEPTWVSFIDAGGKKLFVGLLEPGQTRSVKVSMDAVLRTGNAAGLVLHFNGKPVGPIGTAGQVRQVDFKDGTYQIVPVGITPREK